MNSSSIKTYFIVLLVVVNIALGGLVLTDMWEEVSAEDTGLEDLVSVFGSFGVELSENAYSGNSVTLSGSRVTRTTGAELEFAERLLGPGTTQEDHGGGRMYYSGSNGAAMFRSDGAFEIELPYFSGDGTKSLYAQAEELAATLGLSVENRGEEERTLTYALLRGGVEIVGQHIIFAFGVTGGVKISGVYVLGTEQSSGSCDYADAFTASLKFLREIEAGGILCGSVGDITGVYLFEGSAYVPAWRFGTDSGVYILNATSGELQQE